MNMNEKQFDVREKYMVECIENVTKLVGVPTEESCLKAIEFLEEMGKNKYSDLALTNNMKKSIVILGTVRQIQVIFCHGPNAHDY